jgi:hypothetical protein
MKLRKPSQGRLSAVTTEREWLDHWLSQAPTLSSEALETIAAVLEDAGEED